MELRQLRYMLAVSEARGFTRAAEKVHVSQPSLSQQIRLLEDELGTPLFARGPAGAVLTPAGEVVARQALRMLRCIDEMQQELNDLAELRQGSITIGTLPITGGHILPSVLAEFRRKYPGIKLHLLEERTPILVAATLTGKTDLSLLTLPLNAQELAWDPLLEEELVLAVPANHRLAQIKGNVSLAEAAEEPFVLLKKGNGFRTVCDATCLAVGFTPHCAFESDNIETAKTLVAAGLGVTLVPELIAGLLPRGNRQLANELTTPQPSNQGAAAPPADRQRMPKPPTESIPLQSASLVYIRLQPPPTRTVVVAWRRDRYLSKAAQAFHDLLRNFWLPAGSESV